MATVQETRVKAGYEEIHAIATAKLAGLEETIRKEVEERLAGDKNALLGIIAECVEVVDVDVPDVEENVETSVAGTTTETIY